MLQNLNPEFIKTHNIFANQIIKLEEESYLKVDELCEFVLNQNTYDFRRFSRSLDDIRYDYQDSLMYIVLMYSLKIRSVEDVYKTVSERVNLLKEYSYKRFDEIDDSKSSL